MSIERNFVESIEYISGESPWNFMTDVSGDEQYGDYLIVFSLDSVNWVELSEPILLKLPICLRRNAFSYKSHGSLSFVRLYIKSQRAKHFEEI